MLLSGHMEADGIHQPGGGAECLDALRWPTLNHCRNYLSVSDIFHKRTFLSLNLFVKMLAVPELMSSLLYIYNLSSTVIDTLLLIQHSYGIVYLHVYLISSQLFPSVRHFIIIFVLDYSCNCYCTCVIAMYCFCRCPV